MPHKACNTTQRKTHIAQQQPADEHGEGGFEYISPQSQRPGLEPVYPGHIGSPGVSAALSAHILAQNSPGKNDGHAQRAQQIPGGSDKNVFINFHLYLQ